MAGKQNPFNPKQKKFCEEYVVDLNAKQAAIRAGYSPKTAEQHASRLLRNVKVKKYIAELQEKLRIETNLTAKEVIEELRKVGFSNVQDFIDTDNAIQDISKVEKQKAAAVSGIETSESTSKDGTVTVYTKFKLYNKVDALEKLGKHLGIFEKDNLQQKSDVIIHKNVIKLSDGTEISI